MNILAIEIEVPYAIDARCDDSTLTVDLSDGRTISVPLGWFPRLEYGTPEERDKWCFIGNGHGIHWPDLDEDLSVEGLIAGRPSGEGPGSLKKWLAGRKADSQS